MIFRAFLGEPVEEARELADGHLHHADVPRNPLTGEEEDTDVGFPGPHHHIAEQSWPMAAGMGVLAFFAQFAGIVQVPGLTDWLFGFLDPAFESSPLAAIHPAVGAEWRGLAIGGLISIVGIALSWYLWVARPGLPALFRQRLRPVYLLCLNKWYFDEAIELLVVRPALAVGCFANDVFERVVVDGIVSGTKEAVGDAGGLVRTVQSGFVRSYALLLIAGFAGLALYFLLRAT
jgi:NADH-quinone oxidoreductase subunit L